MIKERVERVRQLRFKGKDCKRSKLSADSVEAVAKAIISWKSDAEPDFFWNLDSIRDALIEDVDKELKEEGHSNPTKEATKRVDEIIGKEFSDRLRGLRLLGLCFLDLFWAQENDWKMLSETGSECVV